jgi:hypothetical protein
MDRFHLQLRTLIPLALLALSACHDDTVAIDTADTEAACARPLSYGYWETGEYELRKIGRELLVCVCMSEAEFESKSRLDDLNEALLEACRQDAAKYAFDWDDCEQDFESRAWIGAEGARVTWPTEGVTTPPGASLRCR